MANSALPISRLIKVSISLGTAAAQAQSLNTLLILGSSPVIDTVTRIREYTSIAQVANDFGTEAPEYLAAVLWFEQNPQPTTLYIGRWVETASAGQLIGAPFIGAQQATLLAALKLVAAGSFDISIDGTAETITALNFEAILNLNGAANIIQTALNTAKAGTTCVWNPTEGTFIITSPTTGAASTVSFATTGTGTDVSSTLGLRQTNSGSYVAPGLVAESALAAVTLFDQSYGQQWYAVTVLGITDPDILNVAPYVEATNTFHYFGVTTQEGSVLTPGDTTSIAFELSQGAFSRTGIQYSSSNPYAVVSLLARILTTNWQGNNTTITLMYKQEPGITAEVLTETQADAIAAVNCNVFAAYNNNTAIIQNGVSSSGDYIDTVIGAAAWAVDTQTAIYNVLFTSTTKIPQTDAGMNIIGNAIETVATQYVNNGFLAPGVWQSAGFGTLTQGSYMSKGFYLFTPPVAGQAQSSRQARISVPYQLAGKLAGAVQSVDLQMTVNP